MIRLLFLLLFFVYVLSANQPPVADAGSPIQITLPATATMGGSATDDGLPSGTVNCTWSKLSGPGTVSFATGIMFTHNDAWGDFAFFQNYQEANGTIDSTPVPESGGLGVCDKPDVSQRRNLPEE